MSRIYEALERAENQRASDVSPDAQAVEPPLFPFAEEQASAKTTGLFEKIAPHPWKPDVVALPTLADSGGPIEQFRSLRSSIYQVRDQITLKTIVVSSGMPAEGKTFVAANLAISLARNNERPVLLIDADLRRPSIHQLLGTTNTPGLTQYLAREEAPTDVLQRATCSDITNEHGAHAISTIAFIPAGKSCDTPPELVGNHRLDELIAALSPHFAWIIIDSPPALMVTDAVDLARVADGVLLVARGDATTFDVAQRAKAAFNNARILGFV